MKKNLLQIILFYALTICALKTTAQTPLPYYSGFDDMAQLNNWYDYRTGFIGNYTWGIASFNPHSAPNYLSHDYEVGGGANDTVIDWFVSPQFDFSSGGLVDSISINLYSIVGTATPADYLGLYLLQGSSDPNTATMTEICNLTGLVSSSNLWVDTGNFAIPPATGNCFIAIRYQSTNNWFVANVDDLKLSANANGIASVNNYSEIKISPNPVKDFLTIEGINKLDTKFNITDVNGKTVKSISSKQDIKIDVSDLKDGVYYIQSKEKYKTSFIKSN